MSRKTTNPERVTNAIIESVDVQSRTIFLFDEINDQGAFHFIIALRLLDMSPGRITVVLSSAGGYDSSGWAIYDAIRQTKNKVRIEGYGHVQSMAAVILQAGDERLLAPNSRFMVHVGSIDGLGDEIEVQKLTGLLRETLVGCERYIHVLAGHAKRPVAAIRKEVEGETFFSAQEAVQLGYADGLLEMNRTKKRKS
jgi:ATP-dependent Clp protease protease subunit